MTNYEYLVIHWVDAGCADQREQLDQLGSQGWELVSVSLQTTSPNHARVHAYLKRPLAKGKK